MSTSLRYLGFAICALIVLSPFVLHAAPVLRSGEAVTVSESQAVDGDFYAAGSSVVVSGPIEGDVIVAGGAVTLNGAIEGDVAAAGGDVELHGDVDDDVRIAAGELTIAGTVRGDVLVAGGILRVLSTATIHGDLIFLAGEAEVAGDVRGSVLGRAESLSLNGPVVGDVSVSVARSFALGDQANVNGSLSYSAATELSRAPGSVVVGDIEKRAWRAPSEDFSLLPILVLLFASLAYLILARSKLEPLMERALDSYGMHGLIGLGVFIAAPLVVLLLLVSIIALPIGLALLFLYALALVLAWSLSGLFAAALISRYAEGTMELSVKWVLLGTLALALIVVVPFIGPLVSAVVSLILLGTLASLLYAWVREDV